MERHADSNTAAGIIRCTHHRELPGVNGVRARLLSPWASSRACDAAWLLSSRVSHRHWLRRAADPRPLLLRLHPRRLLRLHPRLPPLQRH